MVTSIPADLPESEIFEDHVAEIGQRKVAQSALAEPVRVERHPQHDEIGADDGQDHQEQDEYAGYRSPAAERHGRRPRTLADHHREIVAIATPASRRPYQEADRHRDHHEGDAHRRR
jgi:hypothetical protein